MKGLAVWKTQVLPDTIESKEPSLSRSASCSVSCRRTQAGILWCEVSAPPEAEE